MVEMSLDAIAEVVEACKAGAEEAAAAIGRGLDTEVQLSVGEPGSVDAQALPEGLHGPGLAIVWAVGSTGALVLLPESSGLPPPWYGDPDPTGQSKLATLAQELGTVLLPGRYMPDDSRAARVESLSEALTRGGVSDGAAMLPMELRRKDGTSATAHFVWPAVNPSAVVGERLDAPKPTVPSQAQRPSGLKSAAEPRQRPQRGCPTVDDLPGYSRSLLRIKVPVVVTLARERQPIGRILKLGPGSIIQFEKSCEEMLELDVGGHSVARGEAVKVGDKFGLRINSMILPEERFAPVRKE